MTLHVLKAWLHLMAARVAYEGQAPQVGEEVDLGKFGRYMVIAVNASWGQRGGVMLVQDKQFWEENPEKRVEKHHDVQEA